MKKLKLFFALCLAAYCSNVTAQQFNPDPGEIFNIQSEGGYYLAAGGSSDDAYTVKNLSDANSSDDVEWEFVEQSSGLWHVQRAAGGTQPRLRSDKTEIADMNATTSRGTWTRFAIEESSRYSGSYHLTTTTSGHANNRIKLSSDGTVYTVDDGARAAPVSLIFTSLNEDEDEEDEAPENETPEEVGSLYLIIGQSNAAGRGDMPSNPVAYDNVSVLGSSSFIAAEPNLNAYSTIKKDAQPGDYNFGYTFGGSMAYRTGDATQLVVNARGGTSIGEWAEDASVDSTTDSNENYFYSAVSRVLEAYDADPNTQLAGILWHQGESDRNQGADLYKSNISAFISNLRSEINSQLAANSFQSLGDIPFVVGELSYVRDDNADFNENLNAIVNSGDINNIGIASAESLTAPDFTHFDSESLRILGDRYAIEMLKLQGDVNVDLDDLPEHPAYEGEEEEEEEFDLVVGTTYYIESLEGYLLAGYSSESTVADEVESVAGSTTGTTVEWKLVAHESIANAYHIDLTAGGEQPRLYTKDAEIASLTQERFSGTNTYFFIEETSPSTSPKSYHLTASDNSGSNRISLGSNGSVNMVSSTTSNDASSFVFTEVSSNLMASFYSVELNENSSMYPNPASDYINIVAGENVALEKITIYDSVGRTALSYEIDSELNSTNTFSLSTSQLETGIYTVKLYLVDGSTKSHRLVITSN